MSRPTLRPIAERVACPDCGLMQVLPPLGGRQTAVCRRCDGTLAGPATGRVDAPMALAGAALVLLLAAMVWPLITVSSLGAIRESWLTTCVTSLWGQGFPSLAAVVAAFSVALPGIYLVMLTGGLMALKLGIRAPLGRLFRWVQYLRPWMMIEVFLVGGFVAYSRIKVVSTIEIGIGGWCLLAASLLFLLALTQLDERTVWEALPVRDVPVRDMPVRDMPVGGARTPDDPTAPAASADHGQRAIACTVCDLIVLRTEEGSKCSRCAATLYVRKPDALRRTTALVITGFLLYVPANVIPVLTTVRLGRADENTIMSGVLELVHNDLWPLAIIVFSASIVLPLLKLFGLTWMLLATYFRSRHLLVLRTRFYRMIDLVGRWSNIDVFAVSVLIAALRFGALTEVHAGAGLVAFAAVVIITMFATSSFDTRLMWDVI
ncbi:MAG TPA: paraquat-inducible protein A [Steroidobacteraceae bacterium]|nr:paraquat-inducible protein A [Steroidobacteraceae bacterium]